jgi:hypothetical protein
MANFPTRTVAGVGQTTSTRYLVVELGLSVGTDNTHPTFQKPDEHQRTTVHSQGDDVFRVHHHAICCQALSAPKFSISAASTYWSGRQ